ncbi:hypothetical protein ACQUFY_27075 (plasmid) [Robbsia andropogonis]|uniref:hypothetical protein n=1 Tax=Robbsia andropogonis TaxID=28092 RepID=UPI003D220BC4
MSVAAPISYINAAFTAMQAEGISLASTFVSEGKNIAMILLLIMCTWWLVNYLLMGNMQDFMAQTLRSVIKGSFENSVGNAAQRAYALNAVKLSFPAMRNKTVRMVSKRAYPRALRFAA